MTKVLLVCMANVCRSPMACIVAQSLADERFPPRGGLMGLFQKKRLSFHSAGVSASLGESMDPRAGLVLRQQGYATSHGRSRRVAPRDFERYALILAMDQAVLAELARRCPPAFAGKLKLFLDYAAGMQSLDVPDPYYGDLQGFQRVLELCERGARGLIDEIGAPSGVLDTTQA